MRSVSLRLEDMKKNLTIPLGFVGENKHTQVVIDCMKMFRQYPQAIPTLNVTPPEGEKYPAIVERDGDLVKWEVRDSDLIYKGYGEIQLTFVQGDYKSKSYTAGTEIYRSIVATGNVPTPIEDWLTRADATLELIPVTIAEAVAEALAAAKASGEFDGNDGISPTVTVTTITGGHRLTITDANGTRTVDILDGEDGDPGFSPSAKVSKSGKVSTFTVTDKDGTTSVEILDGEDGGGGGSITVDGIVKGDGQGNLSAAVPGTDYGTYSKPIGGIPAEDMAEGVIPDVSGKADQAELATVETTTTASKAYAIGDTFVYDGKLYKATAAITQGGTIVTSGAGANCAETTVEEIRSQLKTEINGIEDSIAPVESSATATSAHAVGELFMLNDSLLVALSAIAVGDTITTTGLSPNAAVTTLSSKLIKDVQVNGSSVLTNGVANVPIASTSAMGAVTLSDNYGVGIDNNGALKIRPATGAAIKSGINIANPIIPGYQHYSAFYGLAKAAGDSTQESSDNAVGTYTGDAKLKIQQMLDVPANNDIAYVETSLVSQRAYDPGEYFVDPSGILSKATDSISVGGSLVLDTNYKHIGGHGGLANDMLAKAELVGEVTLTGDDVPTGAGTVSVPLSKPCRHLVIHVTNGGQNLPGWSYIRLNYGASKPAVQVNSSGNYKRSMIIIDLENKYGFSITKSTSDSYPATIVCGINDSSFIISNDYATEIGFCANSNYADGFNIKVYGR